MEGLLWFERCRVENNLGSDTKNDVKPKERIEFEKIRKKKGTHGWAHDRAAGAETAF